MYFRDPSLLIHRGDGNVSFYTSNFPSFVGFSLLLCVIDRRAVGDDLCWWPQTQEIASIHTHRASHHPCSTMLCSNSTVRHSASSVVLTSTFPSWLQNSKSKEGAEWWAFVLTSKEHFWSTCSPSIKCCTLQLSLCSFSLKQLPINILFLFYYIQILFRN